MFNFLLCLNHEMNFDTYLIEIANNWIPSKNILN